MLCVFNKLKKIYILIFILIITGCSAEYNVTINDVKDVNESLNVTEENKELFDKKNDELSGTTPKEYLETDLNWPTPVDMNIETSPLEPTKIKGVYYYNKKDISTDLKLGINYNYIFKQNDYINSNILNKCYEYKYEVINNVITFKTTSEFKCFEQYPILESAKFNLNTTCNVINSNANKKAKEKLTWDITKNSKNQISYSLDCSKKKNVNVKVPIGFIMPIYVLLVGLGILILRISYKVNNKF